MPDRSTSFSLSLLHPRYWLTWVLLGLSAVLAQLPFRLQMWMGRGLGRLLYHLMATRRYVAERNIELCFPEYSIEQRNRLVKKHFEANGMTVFETGIAWFMPYWRLRKRFVVKGVDCWHALQQSTTGNVGAKSSGKPQGALIMAMHFNTLEITNVAINRLFNMSMSYRPHNNPVYDFVQQYGRERHNGASTAIDRRDVRGMVKAMKRGDWLWYAADQDYGAKVSEFVPWFGIDAAMVSAPPRLAAMANVPMVGIAYRRLPDFSGYEIEFLPAFETIPSGDNSADLRVLNQHFERCIRANPEEYLWVHRRFKTRPPNKARLYSK
ncbi:LpxL/LpxP family Kdo(2)-lipid IV(A) lauroyl/palmitoleoyl acyltransferase [Eionea flava]